MQSTRHRNDRKMVNKPVCEHEDVTVLWNQRVHKKKDTASTPDIIIKNKGKRKHAY
jgi:hypothetical protein